MRTFLRLKNQHPHKLPSAFQHEDLRFPEELVATFLRQFTQPGDIVLDPFAGYGTSMVVAEAMGRIPYGIEIDARRASYIRSRITHTANLIHGDTRKLLAYNLPAIDCSITSPPFMAQDDPENALTGADNDQYAAYLNGLEQIYADMRQVLKPAAHAVLEVSNLKSAAGITTLAWDIARAVGNVLRFEGEVVIGWDHYSYGYDHSYCLVFSNNPPGILAK